VYDCRKFVEDASRGDARAVEALVEHYLPDLERFVARRAGAALLAKESSSDLVQSICREVFQRLEADRFEYQGEREFKQWLYGAALLKLTERARHWRAEKRDTARESALGSTCDSVSPAASDLAASATPSAAAIRHEEGERLRDAIAGLPEQYREIVELAYVEGLPHKEIAARLSISETNSRVLLSRAVARLALLRARPPA
jgi:RNA polymerase sigma-70 factor (ECF subfamily)